MTITIECPVPRCSFRTGQYVVDAARSLLADHVTAEHPSEQLAAGGLTLERRERSGPLLVEQIDAIRHIVASIEPSGVTLIHLEQLRTVQEDVMALVHAATLGIIRGDQ